MGSILEAQVINDLDPTARRLEVVVVAPEVLERIDVIRSEREIESIGCDAARCSASLSLDDLEAGEYLYLRVLQTDGGAAWSSPYFFR